MSKLTKMTKKTQKKTTKNRKNRRLRHSKISVFPKMPFLDPPPKNLFFRNQVTVRAFFGKKSAVSGPHPWGFGPEKWHVDHLNHSFWTPFFPFSRKFVSTHTGIFRGSKKVVQKMTPLFGPPKNPKMAKNPLFDHFLTTF